MKEFIKRLIASYKSILATVTDEAKRKPMEEELQRLESEVAKLPDDQKTPAGPAAPPNDPAAVPEWAKVLQGKVESLTQSLVDSERKLKEQNDAIAAQAKKDRETKIKEKLDAAEKAGKITPAQRKEIYEAMMEKDFDLTSKLIDGLQPNPATKKPELKKDGEADATQRTPSNDYLVNRSAYLDAAKAAFTEGAKN